MPRGPPGPGTRGKEEEEEERRASMKDLEEPPPPPPVLSRAGPVRFSPCWVRIASSKQG